jgi:hypothetical protein
MWNSRAEISTEWKLWLYPTSRIWCIAVVILLSTLQYLLLHRTVHLVTTRTLGRIFMPICLSVWFHIRDRSFCHNAHWQTNYNCERHTCIQQSVWNGHIEVVHCIFSCLNVQLHGKLSYSHAGLEALAYVTVRLYKSAVRQQINDI